MKGEKEWQAWAQDLNDWSDGQTTAANTRIPYQSAMQLDEDEDYDLEETTLTNVPHNFKFIQVKGAEEGDELVKIEDANAVPRNFSF